MIHWGLRAFTLAAAVSTAAVGVAAAETSPGASIVLVDVQTLKAPDSLPRPRDVRLDGEGALVLTVAGQGVVRVPFDGTSIGEPQVLVPENGDGIPVAVHLGLSPEMLVVSAPASILRWFDRRAASYRSGALGTWGSREDAPISFFEDIDVQGKRIAVLGLMRAAEGGQGMSPDGAIAWTGSMDRLPSLQRLAYAKSGKGARPYDACAIFMVGKIRFLPDGRLLLVRGAEPGIHLYSPAGRLLRSWDGSDLDLDLRCDLDDDALVRLGQQPRARLDYINRFKVVDEVLPTSLGPALLVRTVDDEGTHWELALLADDGSISTVPVPFRSKSRSAVLRGDAHGVDLVLALHHLLPDPDADSDPVLVGMRLERRTEAAD